MKGVMCDAPSEKQYCSFGTTALSFLATSLTTALILETASPTAPELFELLSPACSEDSRICARCALQ